MEILELHTLSEGQIQDMLLIMRELDPTIDVTDAMLRAAVEDSATHVFAAMEEEKIVGTACLCISHSPTGCKGGIEDVVVNSAWRGRHFGRKLLEHVIAFARETYAPIDLHLTSRPFREKANLMYQSLGFVRRETNVYKLSLDRKGTVL